MDYLRRADKNFYKVILSSLSGYTSYQIESHRAHGKEDEDRDEPLEVDFLQTAYNLIEVEIAFELVIILVSKKISC